MQSQETTPLHNEPNQKSPGGNNRSIVKNTLMLGGASGINMLIGIVRVKFIAILLGPAGVGLYGIYDSLIGLLTTIFGFGLGQSGVRFIAEKIGRQEYDQVDKVISIYRKLIYVTGGLGTICMVVFCRQFSLFSFQSVDYSTGIAFLGIALFLGMLTSGQSCIIQAHHRVSDVAKINVFSALLGTVVTVPLYYVWGVAAIVPGMIIAAGGRWVVSYYFFRKIPFQTVAVDWQDERKRIFSFFSLGSSLMISNALGIGGIFWVNTLLNRNYGSSACGLYSAAFTMSGIMVGFVIQAIVSDYYPRMAAMINRSRTELCHQVNEQAEISLLLSFPAVLAMSIMAPVVIPLLYSAAFQPSILLLQLMMVGVLLRLIIWPWVYLFVIFGDAFHYIILESLAFAFYTACAYFCIVHFGIVGAVYAFILQYVFYLCLTFLYVWLRFRMRPGLRNIALAAAMLGGLTIFLVIRNYCEEGWLWWFVNLGLLFGISCLCLLRLMKKTHYNIRHFFEKLERRIKC